MLLDSWTLQTPALYENNSRIIQLCLFSSCSADDQGLAATMTNTLDPTLLGASSFKNTTRPAQGATALTNIPRSTKGPGSIAGQSIASAAVTATGRPGSGAKSQVSAVSGASAAKSRASVASAASVGAMQAKDKLAQVS